MQCEITTVLYRSTRLIHALTACYWLVSQNKQTKKAKVPCTQRACKEPSLFQLFNQTNLACTKEFAARTAITS